MDDNSYITTPIYYVNDEPHHGQKVQDAARVNGVDPRTQADRLVVRFREAWRGLHVDHDDFIRTTEERHRRVVTAVLQRLWGGGEIYRAAYEGWYCVPDERFWTDKDVTDLRCPDCGRPVERLSEENYFFRMSRHREWLIDHIESHPDFIQPENRRNEVLGYLRQPLGDLCISRPASRVGWGIPLPFDPGYVTYVWFDALLNYVTAAGYLSRLRALRGAVAERHARHRQGHPDHARRLLADDAPRHRSAAAADDPRPRLVAAGRREDVQVARRRRQAAGAGRAVRRRRAPLLPGQRHRRRPRRRLRRGRAARPVPVRARQRPGQPAAPRGRHDRPLLRRQGPGPGPASDADTALRRRFEGLPAAVFAHVDALEANRAATLAVEAVGEINRYVEHAAPWAAAREGRAGDVETALYHAAEALRLASVLLWPVMPERMAELWRRLGWDAPTPLSEGLSWGCLAAGHAGDARPAALPAPRRVSEAASVGRQVTGGMR